VVEITVVAAGRNRRRLESTGSGLHNPFVDGVDFEAFLVVRFAFRV